MKIDQDNRVRLAEVTRRFLAEEIGAFEFDERIMEIRAESDDSTLQVVAGQLWYHYDDLKDHTAALCKEEWDFIQRLLLILESDAHIHVESRRCWTPVQFAAIFTLAVFGLCAARVGLSSLLIMVSVPFGLVSILLSRWGGRVSRQLALGDPALQPFGSFREIRAARLAARRFTKHRFPPHLQGKRVRSPAEQRLNSVMRSGAWLVYAPIVLAVQALPFVQEKTCVRVEPDAPPATFV